MTDSLAQAMYCEVLQDQAPFWENRTIPRQANAEILFFFSFILSCFLHFLFKEMSSQNESCPDNFTYLLCSSMMVPNCYYNRQKHALVTQFLSKLVTFFVVVTVRSNFFYPIFFLSAFYYPHAPSAGIRSASYRHLPELTHGVRSVRTGV